MKKNSTLHQFIHEMANKYTVMFDVDREEMVEDVPFAFIAQHKRRDERYMITKKMKVYGVENQQLVFANVCEEKLTGHFLKRLHYVMESYASTFIPKHQEHMSTIVLGLIITDQEVDKAIVKEVRRFRKIKFFNYGLHGWAEMYLAIVNPKNKSVEIHAKGRPFVFSIEKILGEEK
ncbi:hypothetical protein OEV98_13075 [Caldibacillus lycopersici]|uniref:DUF8052 domain-containing protein n=1 Tax=Perspicuibacillus lycopersici TaxID=1325689 RepID=A0AAE3LP02_9BACI|nr:hypothetical protein [Perspicuibacillus lycopersici]MCU9614471.1 hypothetical protein [Perspicuibacillus lycopersici]